MSEFIQSNTTAIRDRAQQVTELGPGKCLIDPSGNTIFVCAPNDNYAHDDWAWKNLKTGIEDLLDRGWVRVQYMFPEYLFVDAVVTPTEEQNTALAGFVLDEKLKEREFGRVCLEIGGVEVGDVLG